MATQKLSRRDFLRLSALAGGAALLAACGIKDIPTEAATAVSGSSAVLMKIDELLKAAGVPIPGSPNNPKGWKTLLPDLPAGYPLAKPITIITALPSDSSTMFPSGDDLDNNAWTRMIVATFGIQFKNAISFSDEDEMAQKYNLAMAANDLPDIMQDVPPEVFAQMVEADMLLELGPIWDQYASPRWKAALAGWDDAWAYCTINGKRYGLPHNSGAGSDDVVLWIRQDWLDELGLKAPTTIQELHDVAKAFVDNKMGKSPDLTYGLLANKDFRKTWYGSLDSIWGGYGITTNWEQFAWMKAADGSLQYEGLRPEVKEVLTLLNQWYKDGIFRKDFFTLETEDTDIAAGNCGIHFTPSWGADRSAVENDGAVWTFVDIPAGPKGKFKQTSSPFSYGRFCCPKNFKYAKEWIEMTNWRIEKFETAERRMHGWEGMDYTFDANNEYVKNEIEYRMWTVGPIGTRTGGFADPLANANLLKYKMEWSKIPEDQRDAYQAWFFKDPLYVLENQSQVLIGETNKSEGRVTQFTGLPTPTMAERGADLITMESEFMLSIITGEKPIEAFDEYVANWKSGGGDQITAEVNEWWQTQK